MLSVPIFSLVHTPKEEKGLYIKSMKRGAEKGTPERCHLKGEEKHNVAMKTEKSGLRYYLLTFPLLRSGSLHAMYKRQKKTNTLFTKAGIEKHLESCSTLYVLYISIHQCQNLHYILYCVAHVQHNTLSNFCEVLSLQLLHVGECSSKSQRRESSFSKGRKEERLSLFCFWSLSMIPAAGVFCTNRAERDMCFL